MSSTSSDQSLSLSAAGRNFQLGMVYNANTNELVESLNVLNKCPKVVTKSRLCPSQILELKSSYTIDERMEVFQFDGHMKVGVAFGFLQLGSASGKYVNDMSSSIGQSRMTLQYKETKRYEELDTATVLKLCDNLELLKLARDHEATHFVAGMTYGNQVLMDFKCTEQRDTKNDLLNIKLKRIFRIGQLLADKFNKDNERIITFDDIQCEIFCESKDIKNPTSFNEAKQIYQDLPTTLKNVEAVDCVYLLPLSVIDKDAKKFNKSDIDEVVMKKLVHIHDDLYEHEMRCDDFGKGNINVSEIKASIQKHREEMKQSLSSTTPKVWNREIVKHNSSDFERIKLCKRIKERYRPKTVRRTCPICYIEFSEGSEFVKHMGTHEDRMQYRCGRCDILFNTENELSEHEKTHDIRNRAVQYLECPVSGLSGVVQCLEFSVYRHLVLSGDVPYHECPVSGLSGVVQSLDYGGSERVELSVSREARGTRALQVIGGIEVYVMQAVKPITESNHSSCEAEL